MSILDKIIAQKEKEISGLNKTLKNASPIKAHRDFLKAIRKSRNTKYEIQPSNLIAEIKKASPSKGEIHPDADVVEIAELYELSGAAAISVLTDHEFFMGSLADLHTVSRNVEIPVLRKDFILVPEQILEARLSEADAILLMVSVLQDPNRIRSLREYAESLNMHCLVETASEAEIEIAVEAGARIIGVNARDFQDGELVIKTEKFQKLLPLIPEGIVRVAESGIHTRTDVEAVAPICDAILVGTSLMSEGEMGIEGKIKELIG